MNGDAIAAIAGAVVGALASLAGVFLNHYLRRRGKVRCVVPWLAPEYIRREGASDFINFYFPLRFVNDKELGITVDELRLTYYKSGKEVLVAYINESGAEKPLRYLDLSPRKSVERTIRFSADVADEEAGRGSGEAVTTLFWVYPDGRPETQIIPNPGYEEHESASWWRRIFR